MLRQEETCKWQEEYRALDREVKGVPEERKGHILVKNVKRLQMLAQELTLQSCKRHQIAKRKRQQFGDPIKDANEKTLSTGEQRKRWTEHFQ